eukprot:4398155-Amphidinium_carterae.1
MEVTRAIHSSPPSDSKLELGSEAKGSCKLVSKPSSVKTQQVLMTSYEDISRQTQHQCHNVTFLQIQTNDVLQPTAQRIACDDAILYKRSGSDFAGDLELFIESVCQCVHWDPAIQDQPCLAGAERTSGELKAAADTSY